jgi:hypothetical protein
VATFIAWLLGWIFGLLYPIVAHWVATRSGDLACESWERGLHPEATKPLGPSFETLTLAPALEEVCQFPGAPRREEDSESVPDLYYFAAWTDSGCLLGCQDHHQTVISAANCISVAGGYVIAVENGKLRALNEAEEELFRLAYYGVNAVASRLIVFKPIRAFNTSLN